MTTGPAFEVFWHLHRDQIVRALALTLNDPVLAAEATDEALTRAYQRWHRVSGLDDPAGWVYHVASNWATSWLRKMHRRPTRPRDELDRPVLDHHDDVDVVRAVRKLSVLHREVVVLRFYLDWSVAQIAAALHVPEGTVKSRLHRALAHLQEDAHVR